MDIDNPRTVYRIADVKTGKHEGVYSRSYHDEYDFSSVESARSSNVHDIYKNRAKYKIQKYKVTYELIDEDCDPPSDKEIKNHEKMEALEKEMNDLGLSDPFERFRYSIGKQLLGETKGHTE